MHEFADSMSTLYEHKVVAQNGASFYAPGSSDNGSGSVTSDDGASHNIKPSSSVAGQSNTGGRRRASRAGTRCVSTLSQAQLARKRANDRDAQRAIRQRNREHIDNLERRIEELTSTTRIENDALLDSMRKRNEELELEVKQLKETIATTINMVPQSSPDASLFRAPMSDTGSDESYVINGAINVPGIPQFEGSYQSLVFPDPLVPLSDQQSVFDGMPLNSELSLLNTDRQIHRSWFTNPPMGESMNGGLFAGQQPYGHPLIPPGFEHLIPTSFVNQPSIMSYEIPIRCLPPTGGIDNLLISIVRQQRMSAMRTSRFGKSPDMRGLLFTDNSLAIDPISRTVASVLSQTAMTDMPAKAASLWCMYHLLRWQICPVLDTYEQVPDWFSPRASQLVQPHAIWISQLKWPKLRDKVINNQHLYANDEFLGHYTRNMNVNWPYRGVDIFYYVDGGVRLTPLFEKHISKLENWSLNAPFAQRYPELSECCRFTGYIEEILPTNIDGKYS